jgi:sporulation protein YlmC with PRC-barrel domain
MSSAKAFRKEEIADKTVIDSSGKVAGKVKDITFTLDSTVTLVVVKLDNTEVQVPLSKVMGVSDHVIVREDAFMVKPMPMAAVSSTTVVCRSCGSLAPIGTTWCPGCGKALS